MLTKRQREILAVILAMCQRRDVAVALEMGYKTLDQHIVVIAQRLELPVEYVEFRNVPIGGWFELGGWIGQRVDRSTDRYGGYNAQDARGQRRLLLYHVLVKKCDGP